jgi:anti-anti-sigma factor
MKITERKAGATLVLSLSGRLDAITSPEVDKLVTERLRSGENNLLFDLSELQYISSAGLRILVVTLKQISASRGNMALCALREPVKMVLVVSGFTGFFQIAPTVEDALVLLSHKIESKA